MAVEWKVSCEMMWKLDPEIDAARKLNGWGEFHRECGSEGFYFDHMTRQGKRGQWKVDCFTLTPSCVYQLLVTGTGRTVVDAVADAHERCGRATEETRAALAVLQGVPVADDDFDSLIGDDDFGSLM